MQKSSRNIQSFQEGGVWQEEIAAPPKPMFKIKTKKKKKN